MDAFCGCHCNRITPIDGTAVEPLQSESAAIYEYVTGRPMTATELQQAGERINTLKDLFNIREGWRQEDDTLPPRVLTEMLPTGMVQG